MLEDNWKVKVVEQNKFYRLMLENGQMVKIDSWQILYSGYSLLKRGFYELL